MIASNWGTWAEPSVPKGLGYTRGGRNASACHSSKKDISKGGCPNKKDGCPTKGWHVPRFGLMVGLGL